MSYFKRRQKIYADLDADRVDEGSFTIEGPDHPHFVLTPFITLEAAGVMASLTGDSASDHIAAMSAGAAVVVEKLGGKWALYPGGEADWPDRWASADLEGRRDLAKRFDVGALAKLSQAAQRQATLSEGEQGESAGR